MKGCQKFILILKLMVDNEDTNDIICWNERGDGFLVNDKIKLSNVLPRYFRSGNFSSFHRQLNLYGFKKTRSNKFNPNSFSYKHKYFSRYDSESLRKIQRCLEEFNREDVGTQTDSSAVQENMVDNDGLRVNMLEQEIESMRTEIFELRAGFNSLHAKLANQQNLFYAVFRAMNKSPSKSDVLFNVYLKPGTPVTMTNEATPQLTVNPDYSFAYAKRERRMLPVAAEMSHSVADNNQRIEQTYELFANHYNNNPTFFHDCPIFVPPMDGSDTLLAPGDSVHSVDSLLLGLVNDNDDDTELD